MSDGLLTRRPGPARGVALGVVQGVAEVVPVSSSAQLVLVPWLLGWEQPADRTTFAAGLHAGSCAGIAWALRDDLRALDRRTLALVAAASVPAAVAGLVAADRVEERLGRPRQLAPLLAAAGVLLAVVDHLAERRAVHDRRLGPRTVGPREAGVAGLAQVVALVPGVSRSGAALTALRATGVDRDEAERFSLLMSLPVTAGAAALTLLRSRGRTAAPAAGTLAAALAGATTATYRGRRAGRPLRGPALYRLVIAVVVARRLRSEGES